MSDHPPTLQICVSDTVVMYEGSAPRKRTPKPVKSPYFQPQVEIRYENTIRSVNGRPRGPSIMIEMDALGAAFPM